MILPEACWAESGKIWQRKQVVREFQSHLQISDLCSLEPFLLCFAPITVPAY